MIYFILTTLIAFTGVSSFLFFCSTRDNETHPLLTLLFMVFGILGSTATMMVLWGGVL